MKLSDLVALVIEKHGHHNYTGRMLREPNETKEQWIQRQELLADTPISEKVWKQLDRTGNNPSNYIRNIVNREKRSPSPPSPGPSVPETSHPGSSLQTPSDPSGLSVQTSPIISTFSLPVTEENPPHICLDLTEGVKGVMIPSEATELVWRTNLGNEVKTCAPCLIAEGKNILQKDEDHLRNLAEKFGLTEATTENLIFFSPDMDLNTLLHNIRFHVANNHVVVVTKGLKEKKQENVQFDKRKLQRFLEEDSVLEERPVQAHSMFLKSDYIDAPEEPQNTTIGAFINQFNDKSDAQFILDVPIAQAVGIPSKYIRLDDLASAVTNTARSQKVLVDKAWGLLHQANTFTCCHHDCDGKATIIWPVTGAKLWSFFFPSRSLSATDVHQVQRELCENKLGLPASEKGHFETIFISDGDLVIQPPGIVHQVFTPVPSYFKGSSFWTFDSLHLTRFSRELDQLYGESTTNVDHADELTLGSLVCMALALPMRTDLILYKRPMVALYDMIVNREQFMSKTYIELTARKENWDIKDLHESGSGQTHDL
ncbi:hypothetical protein K435DRAFT_860092 [Dendrothele bispora CBS 962.96]|uniref:JmjC domain-containing protein n=1 Tax=Dendrothele bispora (strain CBS 962.96) TaxID=1314807 RepID=A0A4S8M037_DENBC|nr:hypothetical protein K435DRAFT_860092 [Dendrothele bispora CBS 962.96]